MMAVDITAKDVIFIRQLGRKLEQVKSEQSKLIASREINKLEKQAIAFDVHLQVMTPQDRKFHEANRAAIGVDYVDYFLTPGDLTLDNPFVSVWDLLVVKYPELERAEAPASHDAILKAIKEGVIRAQADAKEKHEAMKNAAENNQKDHMISPQEIAANAAYAAALEIVDKLKTADNFYYQLLEKQKKKVDERLEEQLQLEVDKAALNAEQANSATFERLWANVIAEAHTETDAQDAMLLQANITAPRHHAELLEKLKAHFDDQVTEDSDLSDLNTRYRNARAHYFQLLRAERNEIDELEGDKLNYTLGYERKRIEHEIANYELDQKVLRKGLYWAKFFALAQGFFAAGGTYAFLAMQVPSLSLPAIIVINIAVMASVSFLFFYVARSNWLTINEEMGPLVKALFFNPAHTGWSIWKKLLYLIRNSEFSLRQMFNTAKGATNLTAGVFLGILTFAGSIALLTLTTGFIPMGPSLGKIIFGKAAVVPDFFIAMFGAAPIPIIFLSLLFALVNTFVYFTITNINQQKKNNGTMGGEEKEKELEQLRKVDRASPLHFHKKYGFNIALALGGISATLVGASPVLLELVGAGVTQSTVLSISLFGMGASATLGLAAVIVGAIVFAACYGISSFYQSRTYGATRGLITNSIGAELNAEKLAKKLDVTGREAPNFREIQKERIPKTGLWAILKSIAKYPYNKLFNTKVDDSETARRVNALGQGMPSFTGAYEFFRSLASSAGFAIGGASMVAAASGSYSANSVGLRDVSEDVTELEMLRRDLTTMNNLEGPRDMTATKLGEKKAEVERYASGRERLGEHYGFALASRYTKQDKLDAAHSMTEQLDALVENPAGYTVQDEASTATTQRVEDRGIRTQARINYLYQKHQLNRDKHPDAFNPLRNGELGKIARDTEELMRQWKPGARSA